MWAKNFSEMRSNKCACGSYAINIDVARIVCDVCFWRLREQLLRSQVSELVADWRTEIPKLVLIDPEAADVLESCADELETRLNKEKIQ